MPRRETRTSDWVIWINAKPLQGRLGTETSFGFHPAEREGNILHPGAHGLIKLSIAAEEAA
jgi:hypothetical protein